MSKQEVGYHEFTSHRVEILISRIFLYILDSAQRLFAIYHSPGACFTICLHHGHTITTPYHFSGSRDAHRGALRDHSSQLLNRSPRQGPASSVRRHRITHEVFTYLGTEIAAN